MACASLRHIAAGIPNCMHGGAKPWPVWCISLRGIGQRDHIDPSLLSKINCKQSVRQKHQFEVVRLLCCNDQSLFGPVSISQGVTGNGRVLVKVRGGAFSHISPVEEDLRAVVSGATLPAQALS